MDTHTPELLTVGPISRFGGIHILSGTRSVAIVESSGIVSQKNFDDKANARRLVACWNACDGLDTESIEEGYRTTNVRLMYQIRELRIQRDHFEALAKANGQGIIKTACDLADVKAQRDALLKGLQDMVHIHGSCDTATAALEAIAKAGAA